MQEIKRPMLDPTRVVVGILRKQNRLLISQRPEGKPYSGYWEFPGGKIEKNELAECALKRELYEELGIQVLTALPLLQYAHQYPDQQVLLDVWLIENFLGEPQSKEQQKLRWANLKDIEDLEILSGSLPILTKIKTLIEI